MNGTHLAENVADFQDLQLRAAAQVFNLVHTVGHNDLVESTSVDALDGVTTQTVSYTHLTLPTICSV